MPKLRQHNPEEGDLVLCTVNNITSHGAYVLLDEYDNENGFVHISEIASRWIKNIRNFVRENQKVVCRVLRVNRDKNQIDLSIRRVTDQQKKSKIQEWKRAKNAEGLLKLVSDKLNKTLEEAYEEVGWKLEDKFGEIYFGLENIKEKGIKILEELEIPKIWREIVYEIVNSYVELSNIKISGILKLNCFKPEGIEAIKKALMAGLKKMKEYNTKGRIYLIGSPKYGIEIEAPDYKIGEKIFNETVETIMKNIQDCDGIASWERSK
jgi:translation initiation factor 2 subunit 1